MKNLTRVLALVLVFSMMVSSVAFAAKFTDVEEGTAIAEATDVLSALGIVYGDPDGAYRPNDDITRAEVVAIANRLQGLSEAAKAAGGVTAYTDVAADAWYAGDVNLATQMGIVSGDGDGTFRPNDKVKYEEAVKIMVTTLGYDAKYAEKQGGWPTGYLVIANNANVTTGVTTVAGQEANRGVVAQLAYNALTAPMMFFKQYSDLGEAIYAPQKAKTLLGEKLGYVKIDGVVAATALTQVVSVGSPDEGFIKTTNDLDTATDGTNGTYYKYITGKTELLDLTGIETLAIGATDVDTALGYSASVYVGENEDGDNEVLAYVLNAKRNDVVELNPEFIMATTASTYPSDFTTDGAKFISVYDEDNDTTNKEYNLENGATIIVNGELKGAVTTNGTTAFAGFSGASDLGLIYAPNNGKVELVDSDNNGKYNYIFVTAYETAVVDEVYGQNKKIATSAGTIDLTNAVEGKEGYSFKITKDGEEIAITDLKEDDVISVAPTTVTSNNAKRWDILVSDKKVTGSVTSAYRPASNIVDDFVWTIDGKEYTIANYTGRAYNDSTAGSTMAGDEGTAFIDAFGNLAKFEKTSAVTGDFGFIMAAGPYTSMGKTSYEVQILNKDGSIVTYDLADKVDVTVGASLTPDVAKDTVWASNIKPLALYNSGATVMYWAFNTATTYYEQNGSTSVYSASATNLTPLADIYANRIITYKANSNGKISAITFKANGNNDPETGLFMKATDVATKYNAANKVFANNIGVIDETIVFNLPINASSTEDDFSISTVANFVDEKTYDASFLQVDPDTNDAAVMVVTNAGKQLGESSSLAIATKVMTAKNADGDTVAQITFIQDGEENTLLTSTDLNTTTVVNNLIKTSIFEYSVNAEGDIDEIGFGDGVGLSYTEGFAYTDIHAAKSLINTVAPSYTQAVGYAMGFVTGKDAGAKRLQIKSIDTINGANYATTPADRHAVEGANIYLVDLTKTNKTAVVAAFGDIQITNVNEYNSYKIDDTERDTFVVIKYVKGVATDVIVYKGFAATASIRQ